MKHAASSAPAAPSGLALRTHLRGGDSLTVGPCTCSSHTQFRCWNPYGQQTVLTDPAKAASWESDGNCRVPEYSLLSESNCGCKEESSPLFCSKNGGNPIQMGDAWDTQKFLVNECGACFGPRCSQQAAG